MPSSLILSIVIANDCRWCVVVAETCCADASSTNLSLTIHWSVEDEFWDLTTLNSCSICTLTGALKLECDIAHAHLSHAFLPEEAQFAAVEDHGGCVVGIGFDLNGVLEEDVKGVAGTV